MHQSAYETDLEPPIACEHIGDSVCWARSGRSVVVTVVGDVVDACFFDLAARDARSGDLLAPLYRRVADAYRLDHPSSQRMAHDVAAFLAGEREPRFRFEGFQAP